MAKTAPKITQIQERIFFKKPDYIKKLKHHVWFHLVLVLMTKSALLVWIPVILNELTYTLDKRQMQLTTWHNKTVNLNNSVWSTSMKSALVPIFLRVERGREREYLQLTYFSCITCHHLSGSSWRTRQAESDHEIWFYPLQR